MITISMIEKAGDFAENKDIARDLRLHEIAPALKNDSEEVVLDFAGVTGATQSFVHALVSELLREYGDILFTRLLFKNCNPTVQQVVNIVADYMAES
jgi:hypothetical protein